MSARRGLPAVLLAALALLAGCAGGGGGPGAAARAAAERAAGLRLERVPVPDQALSAGVAAVFTSGIEAGDGQRLVVAVREDGRRERLDARALAALGELAGIGVGPAPPGARLPMPLVAGAGEPVAVIYLAEPPAADRGAAIVAAVRAGS